MKILYSYNKKGYEGDRWAEEIRNASCAESSFIPFNHGARLDPKFYMNALGLDRLYQSQDPRLHSMYGEVRRLIEELEIDALIVANAPPYHPDFLRTLPVYKVLYSADDPGSTYLINIPYLHAYQHVFFVAPGYSRDLEMKEKMRYAGMTNADLLPIAVFDFERAAERDESQTFDHPRPIDIVYVGSFWRQKLGTLKRVRAAFGRRFRMQGLFGVKENVYMNLRHLYGKWISPVSFQERVKLYQSSKLGFNIHWNEYGVGNQRLFHLPANGVMQISDGTDYLSRFFVPGEEIIGYRDPDDLIDKLRYYLANDSAREEIARSAYRRVMREYRFVTVTRRAAELIAAGMARLNWPVVQRLQNDSNKANARANLD